MSGAIWPIVLYLMLLVGLAAAVLWVADFVRRRSIARKCPGPVNAESGFCLPCRFEFTSTTEDLLRAYDTERRVVSGLRPVVRWCIVAMGCAWLGGVIYFWKDASTLQLVLWYALGTGILWKFVLKPFFKRREIRSTADGSRHVVLNLTEDGLSAEVQDEGDFERSWSELSAAINTDEGVLIYFDDNTVNWLPRRIFPSDKHKTDLHAFLARRLRENEEQSLGDDREET